MRVTVVAVGKLKEKYWRDAVAEYAKRLVAYCRLKIVEVPDEGFPVNLSTAEEKKVRVAEWERVARRLRDGAYIVILDVQGEETTSEELAARLDQLGVTGRSDIVFVIGGSLGLPQEALEKADWRLSFSRLTFPHQLMRVILLEQLYRSFKIIRCEPYHK